MDRIVGNHKKKKSNWANWQTLAMKLEHKVQCSQLHNMCIIVLLNKPIIGKPLPLDERRRGRREWPFGSLVFDEAVPHLLLNPVNCCALWGCLFAFVVVPNLHRLTGAVGRGDRVFRHRRLQGGEEGGEVVVGMVEGSVDLVEMDWVGWWWW